MTDKTKTLVFPAEEIFQDIEGDPDNVNMTIPPEIMEAQGWKEGDTIKVEIGDQGTVVITKVEDNQNT